MVLFIPADASKNIKIMETAKLIFERVIGGK